MALNSLLIPSIAKNYYICFDESSHSEYPFTCADNTFFDIVSHTCLDSGFTCTPECEKCSFDCTSPVLGKIATTVDCSVYYTCDTGEWTTCDTATPFFDGNVCQVDELSCCTCKSLCTKSDVSHVMVSDYRNCTNCYLCLDVGIPDETSHGHCPSGNFDPIAHACDVNAPCIQPCAA